MKHIATICAVLLLASCATAENRRAYEAFKADCRLQGYSQGTQDFQDCYKVRKHDYDQAEMQRRLTMMQGYSALGAAWAPQPSPAPMPQPVQPRTQFCYPGQGFVYCQ